MKNVTHTKAALSVILPLFVIGLQARADMHRHWRYAGGPPVFNRANVDKCALPFNEKVTILHRKGYDVGFAPRLGVCLWVAYSLVPGDVTNMVGRVGNFRRDDDVWLHVISPDAYAGSGYDRGHMAPSQDMQYDIDVSRQSFWMANIIPQTPRLNRGTWKGLESRIHSKVVPDPQSGEVQANRVFVLTGPVFDKQSLILFERERAVYEKNGRVGRPPIPRPCACWKIFKYGASTYAVLFSQSGKASSTTAKEISRLTGLSFFNELPHGLKAYHESVCHMIYLTKTTEKDN